MKQLLMTFFVLIACQYATAQTQIIRRNLPKPLDLENIVLNQNLWKMQIADFEKKYKPNGFVYMSATKKSLRAEGGNFKLFGENVGEVIVRSNDGRVGVISMSIYNRGDNGDMSLSVFEKKYKKIYNAISQKTGVRPRDLSDNKSTVKLTRIVWVWKDSAILLEKSISKDHKHPEFLRLKMKSKNTRKKRMANRSSLNSHVLRDRETGDVYIQDIPMVDQGRKGYCAVASAARVYQYYGLDVDQHELAQIAGTGPGSGTSLGEMVKALRKVTSRVHSKVLVLYEYPRGIADSADSKRAGKNYYMGLKEFARDVKSYNKLAKKQGKGTFPADVDKGLIPRDAFSRQCDREIYRTVMTKKSSFKRFKNIIYRYIDQGVPVGWCLQLGMFKEEGLPQTYGGHMRLIIGYNKKTGELIYTDSWGAGHGKKKMPAGNAFCMTSALVVLPPTK